MTKPEVQIELFAVSVSAGESLQGVVHLHVPHSLPLSGLFLKLSGKEITQLPRSLTQSAANFQGKHYFLKQEFPLVKFEGTLVPVGHESYPFSIRTPANMSASVSLKRDGVKAEVQYTLTVKGFGGAIKAKTTFSIVNEPSITASARDMPERRAAIRSWCCISRGEVSLSGSLDKDVYISGEEIKAEIKVNNKNCSLTVVGLRATIHRNLSVSTQQGLTHSEEDVLNDSFTACSVPGGKDSLLSVQQITVSVPTVEREGKTFTAQSVRGRLIDCSYTLQIEALMQGCFSLGGQRAKLFHRLLICKAAATSPGCKVKPNDWTSRVAPLATFDCGEHYDVLPRSK